MKLVLIRHGATEGNLEKRYIGRTDEPLCGKGKEQLNTYLHNGVYPPVQRVFSSPMRRCIETAKYIYPDKKTVVLNDLKECDFGTFEGKNYIELSRNHEYQQWIDSNGTIPFPNGENLETFKKRSVNAFLNIISQLRNGCEEKGNISTAACVVHGGTVMSVLSRLYGGDYYDYQCGNGEGYLCMIKDNGRISEIQKLHYNK